MASSTKPKQTAARGDALLRSTRKQLLTLAADVTDNQNAPRVVGALLRAISLLDDAAHHLATPARDAALPMASVGNAINPPSPGNAGTHANQPQTTTPARGTRDTVEPNRSTVVR